MSEKVIVCFFVLSLMAFNTIANESIATLRGQTSLSNEATPPLMEKVENRDIKRKRNYPMQPPTIPHKINNYQVDLKTNKCLTCHSRKYTEQSQAPMISVTHYMDRDGNFLADVSPRRYFCKQCHVTQTVATPLVDNSFMDIDDILKAERNQR